MIYYESADRELQISYSNFLPMYDFKYLNRKMYQVHIRVTPDGRLVYPIGTLLKSNDDLVHIHVKHLRNVLLKSHSI